MAYYNNGGYNNHRDNYGHRINEEDVPESKHAIFVRGLPGNMTTDEVKEFFESKIGPCSFDFTKVSQDRSRLFVAVRFETREDAKEAYSRYKDGEIMGFRCELSWFKDIRRFASYQAAQQGGYNRGGGGMMRGRPGNNYTPRNSYQRKDDRSSHEKKRRRSKDSRSGSRDSSRSRSRSPRSRSRSGSRSKSRSTSRDSRDSRKRDASKESRGSSPERETKKKSRKDKKRSRKDKKRSKRSHSYSSGSDGEVHSDEEKDKKDRESRNSRRSRSRSASKNTKAIVVERDRSESPPMLPLKEKEDKEYKISIQLPTNPTAALLQKTSFTLGLDGDESPKRIVRKVSVERENRPMSISPEAEEEPKAAVIPPPPLPPTIDIPTPPRRGKFKPIDNGEDRTRTPEIPPPPKKARSRTPSPVYVKKEVPETVRVPVREKSISPPPPPRQEPKVDRTPNTPRMKATKFPVTAKLFADLKQFQSDLIASVKAEPKEEETNGGLSLSSLGMDGVDPEEEAALKMKEREMNLASLDDMQMERYVIRKKQLEGQFKNDCNTYTVVTKMLLKKDAVLEKPIRIALIETIDDLEKKMLDKLDAYVETLLL